MFSFFSNSGARAEGNVVQSSNAPSIRSLLGVGDRGQPNERQVRQSLRGTFEACLRTRAKLFARSVVADIGQSRWQVQRRVDGEWEPVEESHPWLQLLRRPNEYRSAYDFWYWVSMARDTKGTASQVVRDGPRGVPDGLLEIYQRFGRVRPQGNEEGGLDGYVYHPRTGTPTELELRDVVQVKRMDPTTPYESSSLVESLAYEVDADRFASQYRKNTFRDGRPPMVQLTTDEDISTTKAKEIGERWKDEYMQKGGDVKGVPVGTHGFKAEALGIDPERFQMLESQGLDHKVIFRTTGILEAYFEKGANRSESEAAERKVLEGTIQPIVNQTASQMTLSFEQAFRAEQGRLRIVGPDLSQVDPKEEEEILQQRLKRGVPPAEIMREQNEEVPDAFEEELETPRLPSTLRPIGGGDGEPPDFL